MKYQSKTVEERKAEIDSLIKSISQGIEDYIKSGKYREILDNLSTFHQYSLNNSLLIALQKPDATYVASYATWKQKFNRQVNAGEKGIKIFCPVIYHEKNKKDTETTENKKEEIDEAVESTMEASKIRFKIGNVFDVSQTSQIKGKEVIVFNPCRDLTGVVDNFDAYLKAIREVSPVDVEIRHLNESVKGYYDRNEQLIVIQEGMSEMQTIKTGIHELAHSIIHSDEEENKKNGFTRADKEVQAESTAYVVAKHFGIDSKDYSFPYVAAWAGDIERIKNNLEVVRNASNFIIENMEKSLATQEELLKGRSETISLSPADLAKEITEFAKELDPYSFAGNENYRGETYEKTFADVRKGRLDAIKDYLSEVIDENNDMAIKDTAIGLMDEISSYEKTFADDGESLNASKEFRMKF